MSYYVSLPEDSECKLGHHLFWMLYGSVWHLISDFAPINAESTSMAIDRRCDGPAAVNGNPLQGRAGRAGRQRTWHGGSI